MKEENIIITNNESITISQSTDTSNSQEIQTIILDLKKPEEIIEFN